MLGNIPPEYALLTGTLIIIIGGGLWIYNQARAAFEKGDGGKRTITGQPISIKAADEFVLVKDHIELATRVDETTADLARRIEENAVETRATLAQAADISRQSREKIYMQLRSQEQLIAKLIEQNRSQEKRQDRTDTKLDTILDRLPKPSQNND